MKIATCKLFVDYLNPFESHIHAMNREIVSKQTKYHKMEIIETAGYGTCLVLDGKIQSTEADECIYHEALVHPAMLAHPDPRNVFIVGGGEGATLREVLKYSGVGHVRMIDIDEEVVDCSKKYLHSLHQGAYKDKRVTLEFQDARKVLEETDEKYDVIIIDISEPVEAGPAYLLYTQDFYKIVMDKLTDGGIISLQAGSVNIARMPVFTAVCKTIKSVFPVVLPYFASIPSFGSPWGFLIAAKKEPGNYFDEKYISSRMNEFHESLRYYNFDIHKGQFLLPKYIRTGIAKEKKIIEDNNPLYAPGSIDC